MPNALLSVADKTGLVEFAGSLSDLGWRLIASGGTAKAVRNAGIQVTDVSEYTGSPEILGGRVKTLHPAIHGGLLARDLRDDWSELGKLGWEQIDLTAVNLYPFSETVSDNDATFADAIENIDIGGVALIRAAAKNQRDVAVVTNPGQYPDIISELEMNDGSLSAETRFGLAKSALVLIIVQLALQSPAVTSPARSTPVLGELG